MEIRRPVVLRKTSTLLMLLRSAAGRRRIVHIARRWRWSFFQHAARLYRRTLAHHVRVVAIVGSFGKSTTSIALGSVLDVSVLWKVLHTKNRVARAILHILPWQKHAVIEIGLGGKGQMGMNARIAAPNIVVFTSIGSEHNRTYGSLDEIRDAKLAILQGLRKPGLVVLNADDERVRAIAAMTSARVITYGFGQADVRAIDFETLWPHGTRIKIALGDQSASFMVKLYGRVMVYPILAAIAVAIAEGYSLQRVIDKLQNISALPGRLQTITLEGGITLIRDEYKSTLETIDSALDTIAALPAGRRVIVLGEISEPPGNQGALYRRLGARLGRIGSRVVIVGQKKAFQSYARGAKSIGARVPFIHVRRISEAIEAVRSDLRTGDIVLIKGRDTQRLDRIALALQGHKVDCEVSFCRKQTTRCDGCRQLAAGFRWHTRV
jgi:UDP-N-acetylmuramoyl-tripeptide--D-alanyl-D-alanine ligase